MRLSYIAIILSLCIRISAQTPKQYLTIESPNAASLKGVIESPLTLNTGRVGLSIPLYTLKENGIQVPIALTYNSGGVKLDMHPSWVGSNWSLQTGGVVTRTVRGVPDELYWRNDFLITDSENTTGSQVLPYGYVYNDVNSGANWNTTGRITELAKAGKEPGTLWVEAEPDEFVFNCGNYSGKFYLDHTGALRVQSHPEIKVEGDVIINVPLYDPSTSLDPNDPTSFTYVSEEILGTDPSGNPIIVYIFNRISKAYLLGFKITTPDGMEYEFGMYGQEFGSGNSFNSVEWTSSLTDPYYLDEVFTTWHLKKITAPNKEFVEFTYEAADHVIQLGASFSFYKASGSAKGFLSFIFGDISASTQDARLSMTGRFVRPLYLKTIKSNSTLITFEKSYSSELDYDESYEALAWEILDRSESYPTNVFSSWYARPMVGDLYLNLPWPYTYPPGIIDYGNNHYAIIRHDGYVEEIYFGRLNWAKLNRITVTSRSNNTIVQGWLFNYNNTPSERLQLASLMETGKTGSYSTPYTFEYDKSKTLPGYNSFLTDHWGYYNNRPAPVDIDDPVSLSEYKTFRDPVEEFMYAGSLIKVTTPTQGTKEFIYEPNKYSFIVKRNTSTGAFSLEPVSGGEKTGAGLRIRQIIEKPGEGSPDITTTYSYGSGTLLGDVQYYWPNYKGKLLNGNEFVSTRFVTESLLPISENPGGGIISYQLITEEQTGNGKTTFEYRDFSTNPDEAGISIDLEKSPYSPFTSRGFERGLLKAIRTYENANATTEIYSEVYDYAVNPGFSTDFVRAVEAKGTTLFGSDEVNLIEGTAYKYYLHPYQVKSKTTKVRDKSINTFRTTLEEYTYNTNTAFNNDNQLKEVRLTSSSGEVMLTKYKHPLDFVVNDGATELTGLNALKSSHIFDKTITQETSIKAPGQTTFSVISYTLNTFLKDAQGIPLPKAVYDLKLSSPTTTNATTISGSTFTLDPRLQIEVSFDKHDSKGNVLQFTTSEGIPVTILYGYNYQHPVAQIKNATYDEVLAVLGQTVIDQLNASPGTDANVRSSLQILRTASSLDKALVTTYTYNPLVGMTSMTDPNNVTTYYEYDSFSRLKLVKDNNQHIVKAIGYNHQFK